MTKHADEYLLTEKDAAELIGVSPPALNTARKRGNGPPFYEGRIPGVVGAHRGYYKKGEVLQWARSRDWSSAARNLRIKTKTKRKN